LDAPGKHIVIRSAACFVGSAVCCRLSPRLDCPALGSWLGTTTDVKVFLIAFRYLRMRHEAGPRKVGAIGHSERGSRPLPACTWWPPLRLLTASRPLRPWLRARRARERAASSWHPMTWRGECGPRARLGRHWRTCSAPGCLFGTRRSARKHSNPPV